MKVEVEYKITGTGTLYGDGMAIWFTKQRSVGGPVFGFMDKFEGLGIFIDTYKNDRPGVVFPYVMAMMGDGNTPYDKAHDGKANELGGCPVRSISITSLSCLYTNDCFQGRNIRNNAYPTKIKITYLHDKSLTVQLASEADPDRWEPCFTLPNVKIPSVAYLGFSAETGELADSHDIIKIEARNLYNPDGSRPTKSGSGSGGKKNRKRPKDSSGGGWGWFFIKFIIFGLVLAGAWAGFVAYRAQQTRSRF
jgi:mannose-binding lectin 2